MKVNLRKTQQELRGSSNAQRQRVTLEPKAVFPREISFPKEIARRPLTNAQSMRCFPQFPDSNRRDESKKRLRIKTLIDERRRKVLTEAPNVVIPSIQMTFSSSELQLDPHPLQRDNSTSQLLKRMDQASPHGPKVNKSGQLNNPVKFPKGDLQKLLNHLSQPYSSESLVIETSKRGLVGYSQSSNSLNRVSSQGAQIGHVQQQIQRQSLKPLSSEGPSSALDRNFHEVDDAYFKTPNFDAYKLLNSAFSPEKTRLQTLDPGSRNQEGDTKMKFKTSPTNQDLSRDSDTNEYTSKAKESNQHFLTKLSHHGSKILEQLQLEPMLKTLAQLFYELENQRQSKQTQLRLLRDFDSNLKKFLSNISTKFDQLVKKSHEQQKTLIHEKQEKETILSELNEIKFDNQLEEKYTMKAKICKLSSMLDELQNQKVRDEEQHNKQMTLLQIKVDELKRINLQLSSKDQGEALVKMVYEPKIKELKQLLLKLDSDLKAKDNLILKLQWSRGETKDLVLERESDIEVLKKEIKGYQEEIIDLRKDILKHQETIGDKEAVIEQKKSDYYKLQDDFKRKCDTFDTIKAVAKEIQKKNEELQKEVLMGNGGLMQNDPLGAEINIDQFLFGSANPYALSNNTKLSIILKGKDLKIANSGLETQVIRESEMTRVDTQTEKAKIKNQASHNELSQVISFKDFPLYQYNYGRPAFLNLIEHMIPGHFQNPHNQSQNKERKLKFDPPYPQWLFSTCRAILDSKYYEYVLHEDIGFSSVSRIVDFAYSWIGCFCVDESTRQIRQLQFDERDKVDDLRLQFAIGLQSVKSSKVWEYQIMNDCLSEKYAHDELFFYLHSRQILFNGPQLNESSGTHERIFNVSLARVKETIKVVFFKMTPNEKEQILQKIITLQTEAVVIYQEQQKRRRELKDEKDEVGAAKEKQQQQKKTKKKEASPKPLEALDSQIVLRIFMEYYVREKKVRAFILKRFFEEEPKQGSNTKGSISFYSFKRILEQFDPELTSIEIASLFREAWTSGNGVVNFDSFFLVANEKSFFLKTIRVMGFNVVPALNMMEDFDQEDQHQVKLDMVYTFWKKNESLFLAIKKHMEVSGNELMLSKIVSFQDMLRKKSQTDLSRFRGRNMIQVLRRLWQWVLYYRAAFLEVYEKEPYCQSSIDALQSEFNKYTDLGKLVESEIVKVRAGHFERTNKIRKLQKMYRDKKDSEWERMKQDILS